MSGASTRALASREGYRLWAPTYDVEQVIAEGQRPDVRHTQQQLGSLTLAAYHHLGNQVDTDSSARPLGNSRR